MDKKERNRLAVKKYRKNNPEKVKISHQKSNIKYLSSLHGQKANRIANWKHLGIIDGDFETLYNEFVNTKECWICGHDFSKHKKCLDHDHDTGEVRYICCNNCNSHFLSLRCNNFRINVK